MSTIVERDAMCCHMHACVCVYALTRTGTVSQPSRVLCVSDAKCAELLAQSATREWPHPLRMSTFAVMLCSPATQMKLAPFSRLLPNPSYMRQRLPFLYFKLKMIAHPSYMRECGPFLYFRLKMIAACPLNVQDLCLFSLTDANLCSRF
jgi:hypothetical protein